MNKIGTERGITIIAVILLLFSGTAYAISSVDQGFQAGWFIGDIANGTIGGLSVSSLISSLQGNDTADRTYVNDTFLPIATYSGDFPNSTLNSYAGDFPNSSISDMATLTALASTTAGSEGATLIGYTAGETVWDMINLTTNNGVMYGLKITDQGGLNITWTAGRIFDRVTGDIVDITAQTTNVTLTDNAINFVKWKSGTTLTVEVTGMTGGDIYIARIDTLINDIHLINQAENLNTVVQKLRRSSMELFPVVITSGMVVSEKTGASAFDVVSSSGIYYEGHDPIEVAVIDSTITPLNRIGHSGGVWTDVTNATIDATKYDNGTELVATTANKYYKSLFLIGHDEIHWIYPQAQYNTIAEAINGPIPTIPEGLTYHPKSVTVVLKGDAAAFPTAGGEQWQDVRPTLSGNVAATSISDHGSLAGLADNDHPQYLLTATYNGNFPNATVAENLANWNATYNSTYDTTTTTVNANLAAWNATYNNSYETTSLNFIISNGTNAIGTGIKGDVEIPFAGTIITARALGDQTGSINVSYWKDTYANFPPTAADLLGNIAIAAGTKAESTGLSQAITAGDILRFNVVSNDVITKVTVSLTIRRS